LGHFGRLDPRHRCQADGGFYTAADVAVISTARHGGFEAQLLQITKKVGLNAYQHEAAGQPVAKVDHHVAYPGRRQGVIAMPLNSLHLVETDDQGKVWTGQPTEGEHQFTGTLFPCTRGVRVRPDPDCRPVLARQCRALQPGNRLGTVASPEQMGQNLREFRGQSPLAADLGNQLRQAGPLGTRRDGASAAKHLLQPEQQGGFQPAAPAAGGIQQTGDQLPAQMAPEALGVGV
jgi:hypothetical protein